VTSEQRQRPPEQLAKEIWFYSLQRRARSATLRRVSITVTVIAVLLAFGALLQLPTAAGALGAVATVLVLETAGYLRASRQKALILAQLREGANPQLVDSVGSAYPNRSVILVAAACGIAAGVVSALLMGQFS
jgi:hypothetical protein